LYLPSGHISAARAISNSDIWTAINIIASDIARVKFHSSDETIDRLLNNPSALTNRFSFYQSMVVQMLLTGNAYALRRENLFGKEYWEFVPPSAVTQWLADDGQSLVYDFHFANPGEPDELKVQASDVIHMRWTSIDGGLVGQSPLVSLKNELAMQDSSRRLSLTALKNAFNPTSVIKFDNQKLDSKAKQKVRDEFEKANSGDNAGRLLVLDSLADYNQLEIKTDIAKLLASTDFTKEQIAKAFLLPINMFGGESAHSNTEQIRGDYNQTFARYLASVIDAISSALGVQISADVREATDLDGSQIESRVNEMVRDGVINADMAQIILSDSQSDLITPTIIAKARLNSIVKEVSGSGETGSSEPVRESGTS
jgi:HK97 family phage portal protein